MVHVLAVADTDSYLKWSVSTLATLPAGWTSHQVLLRNAVMPSPDQVAAAGQPDVEVVGLTRLLALLVRERPDVVLLSCTGPVVATVARLPPLRAARRPVLVTGLPGISVPASPRAVLLRRSCDLFVVHSRRERVEFARVAVEQAPGLRLGLARLPFLSLTEQDLRAVDPEQVRSVAASSPPPDGPVVFAAQAQVPREREERESVLRALAVAAPAVVKLRAAAGEQQTHREDHPYDVLWADLVRRGEVPAGRVAFATGSMTAALDGARGLATVSSTAALEAVALGLPILVVDDFGVSGELINLVFEGSGCTGSLASLAGGGLRTPDPEWLTDNYFHPDEDSDWIDRLQALVLLRTRRVLPRVRPPAPRRRVAALRQYLRLLLTPRDLAHAERVLGAVSRWSRSPRERGRRARGRLPGRLAGPGSAGPPPAPPAGRQPPPAASRPAPSGRGR